VTRILTSMFAVIDFATKAAYSNKVTFAGDANQKFFNLILVGRLVLPIIPWLYTVLLVVKESQMEYEPKTYVEDARAVKRKENIKAIISANHSRKNS
jgi:hypothetical protein